jgi:hypothetical protein
MDDRGMRPAATAGAAQALNYLSLNSEPGALPTQETLIAERFFDEGAACNSSPRPFWRG